MQLSTSDDRKEEHIKCKTSKKKNTERKKIFIKLNVKYQRYEGFWFACCGK